MKIVTVGASGLLGSVLVPALRLTDYDVATIGRSIDSDVRCDAGNLESLLFVLNDLQPDVLINLVALTDVDQCESEPKQAFLVNLRTAENLVKWVESRLKTCHLVHISTDQIYDGPGPHYEDDVMLTNYYGFSKYASELAVQRIASTVLRTNFFGKSMTDKSTSFTDWIYESVVNSRKIALFNDVFFSPLSMGTLVEMIVLVVSKKPLGIFNLGSRSGLSKSEFAQLFMEKLKLGMANVDIVSIDDVSFMKTYRPRDMRLQVEKFERELDIVLPTLESEINRVIGDYNEKT
jgi:dTDP-4-dehydrorhamnose reductase